MPSFLFKETRLGKLINDLRKKTKNEDLARRAKKILRTWQKLIEADSDEMLLKRNTGTSRSLSGEGSPCVPLLATSSKPDLGNNNEFNHFLPPNQDRPENHKIKVDQKEGQFLVKKCKMNLNDKMQMPNNLERHLNNSIEISSSTNSKKCQHSDRGISESFTNKRLHKILINSIQPQPIGRRYSRSLSTSALHKVPVLQHQASQEQVASRGHCRVRGSLQTSQTLTQEALVKQVAPAQEQSVSNTKMRPGSEGNLEPSAQPSGYCVKNFRRSWSADSGSQKCTTLSTSVNRDHRQDSDSTGKREGQKYRPKGNDACADTLALQRSTKPLQLTDKRIKLEPETGRKTLFSQLECSPDKEVKLDNQPQGSEQTRPNPSCPFQLTDRKRLSRSEIIQSYLSRQSSVQTSSCVRTHGEYVFMTDFFKKGVQQSQDTKTKHALATQVPVEDLPGITREVTKDDLSRLNTQHWPGVNGCYDTKGVWYDWTQCVSLDPNGDGKKLKILPYVCLDLM